MFMPREMWPNFFSSTTFIQSISLQSKYLGIDSTRQTSLVPSTNIYQMNLISFEWELKQNVKLHVIQYGFIIQKRFHYLFSDLIYTIIISQYKSRSLPIYLRKVDLTVETQKKGKYSVYVSGFRWPLNQLQLYHKKTKDTILQNSLIRADAQLSIVNCL